jgi:molybdopterin converting factor small subunit
MTSTGIPAVPPSRNVRATVIVNHAAWLRSSPVSTVDLRLFAAAREAAGTGHDELPGSTVGDVLDAACRRYGAGFREVLAVSRVWLNGAPAACADPVSPGDEVAVLPPVSGGSG